jgi:hypothetical protein
MRNVEASVQQNEVPLVKLAKWKCCGLQVLFVLLSHLPGLFCYDIHPHRILFIFLYIYNNFVTVSESSETAQMRITIAKNFR